MPENHSASLPRLLVQIEDDRNVLAGLIERTRTSPGGVKGGAWLAERVSRLKLKHGSAEGLGTFEALEFLALGIHGKWALWRARSVVAGNDSRLQGTDFDELTARA